MAISFLMHAGQFLKFIANQVITSFFPSGLRFFTCDRSHSEEESFFRNIFKLIVDTSAQKDGLITDESDIHKVIGRM